MFSYFLGQPPFTTPKSRKDIPDAFIYQALQSISESNGYLYFICDDKNLRESCSKLSKVTGLEGYAELYDLPEFQEIKNRYQKIEHYVDELIILEQNIDKIKTHANSELLDNLLFGTIIPNLGISDFTDEGYITNIDEIYNIEINKVEIQYIDDYFYIPIKAEGICSIEYTFLKSEYYSYIDSRNIHIIDNDWNDHYFLAEENFNIKFSFKYKIKKDKINTFEFEVEDIDFDEVNIIENK